MCRKLIKEKGLISAFMTHLFFKVTPSQFFLIFYFLFHALFLLSAIPPPPMPFASIMCWPLRMVNNDLMFVQARPFKTLWTTGGTPKIKNENGVDESLVRIQFIKSLLEFMYRICSHSSTNSFVAR